MWQPLSKILEIISRIRLPLGGPKAAVHAGHPEAPDIYGEQIWREYLSAEKLFDLWGPVPGSPWEPFHCVTLFAAIDAIPSSAMGPTAPEQAALPEAGPFVWGASPADRPAAPGWTGSDCLVVVDLPGRQAVAAGAGFVSAGFQPVCTFDHWPHPAGLLKPEHLLAELLRQTPRVARWRRRLSAASPPVWICDSERLGTRVGVPREFDNRYYLDESLVPGPELLARQGVRRIVCVLSTPAAVLVRDLEAYLIDLHQRGLRIFLTTVADPQLELSPHQPTRSSRHPTWSGFHRSSAGGFGMLVPEPSSGGS